MARRKSSTGKKRTISPEHLAKLQAGRAKKRKHDERMASLSELETRLRKGANSR